MKLYCPLCGCGTLRESSIMGYKCDNCGELFEVTDNGIITVISFDEWKAALEQKDGDLYDLF